MMWNTLSSLARLESWGVEEGVTGERVSQRRRSGTGEGYSGEIAECRRGHWSHIADWTDWPLAGVRAAGSSSTGVHVSDLLIGMMLTPNVYSDFIPTLSCLLETK